MSQIGQNIRKIRSAKKLSQTQFAEIFELTRGSVGAYEEGRAEPKIDTIIQIANYFSVSIDLLLNKEVTTNDLFHLDVFRQKLNEAHSFEKRDSSVFTASGVEYITVKNQLEYVVNWSNRDFIANLPRISLPNKSKKKVRAFELEGSAMEFNQNGLHHGDILLATEVDNVQHTEVGNIYVAVHKEGILIRRAGPRTKTVITLSCDDPNYPDKNLPIKEILELWLVEGVYSTYLNPPKLIDQKVLELERRVELLEAEQTAQL